MTAYEWDGHALVPREQDVAGPLEAADSWRQVDGRANGLELHLARFEAAAGALPSGFRDAMGPLVATGDLFPRVSVSRGRLLFDVRPAPPPRPATALTAVRAPDPRARPRAKGPDFAALADFRDRYQRAGTHDTLITDSAGRICETTTGAVVAWDGATLVVPAGEKLPSVTLRQVLEHARRDGVQVREVPLGFTACEHHPVWFLNSLHGISPVSKIVSSCGHTITPPPHPQAREWAAWWWEGFA